MSTFELSRFLGVTGTYRNFIDQYAAITANLTNLLHKDVEWHFGLMYMSQRIQFIPIRKFYYGYKISKIHNEKWKDGINNYFIKCPYKGNIRSL